MKVAISGAGIAGPTLAHWLLRLGHEVTLIEKAPRLRTGGYLVDFWGVGYTIAERMGILPQVLDAGYHFKELRLLNGAGRKAGGFSTDVLMRMTGGRFTTVPRGDLAAIIYGSLGDGVETLFGTSISEISEHEDGVRIVLSDGSVREVDLVVGADGLHSKVRSLAFGAQTQFEKPLEYRVASFAADGYEPRDELVYVASAAPGKQFARIALRGNRTMFLFVFRADLMSRADPSNIAETRAVLREVFGNIGWESPRFLSAADTAREIYYDRVSQITMPSWSKGRVTLIGDAAGAVSLLAGEGTGVAMTAAYVLAGELHRANGDYRTAFRAYEDILRPFVERKQRAAEGFAKSFLPRTALGVWVRNKVTKLMHVPKLADVFLGASVRDDFDLPQYDMVPAAQVLDLRGL